MSFRWAFMAVGAVSIMAAGNRTAEAQPTAAPPGIFEGHGDVGDLLHSGGVAYDLAGKSYTVSGSGENMWFAKDAFHFVWKKVSGDLSLTADVDVRGVRVQALP